MYGGGIGQGRERGERHVGGCGLDHAELRRVAAWREEGLRASLCSMIVWGTWDNGGWRGWVRVYKAVFDGLPTALSFKFRTWRLNHPLFSLQPIPPLTASSTSQ